jgi:HK97 family phage major capsid protein
MTIIGKLNGLSRVPFNIRYGIQDGGSTVGWVGQGLPKAVTKLHFTSGSLGFAKAAGIVVITQELARFSSPSAEMKVRDDLTAQMVQFLDAQFIDPSVAAVANVSPASVLNGASNVRQAAAAWTSMANVLTDVKVFLSTFAAQEISLQGAYWIMTPDTALSLGLLLNTGGTAFAFPEIDVNGGTFVGLPVIVSNSVPHSTSAGAIVALVVPKHIYLADDGAVAIDSSTEASLQMDSAPGTQDATSGTGTSLVSMFQTNSIAIRVERIINWSRARSYGVGYIDNMHTS